MSSTENVDFARKITVEIMKERSGLTHRTLQEWESYLVQELSKITGDWYTILTILRTVGWRVAVHNDYYDSHSQKLMTFWLLTNASIRSGIIAVKGEGETDEAAIKECVRQIRRIK